MTLAIPTAINSELYGTLPQLAWFEGGACVPTSVTNALVGLARQDGLTGLMADPAAPFSYASILNTRNDLASNYYYTSNSWEGARSITTGEPTATGVGSPGSLTLSGLARYLKERNLGDDIQIEAMGIDLLGGFGVKSNNPIGGEFRTTPFLEDPLFKNDVKFTSLGLNKEDPEKLFSFMMISLLRGALVFGGFYNQTNAAGHALLATGLTLNDHNSNGTFDAEESASLTFIDPLDPATQYTPALGSPIQTLGQFNAVAPTGTTNFITAPITVNTTNPGYAFLPENSPFNLLSITYPQGAIGVDYEENFNVPPEGGLPTPLPLAIFGGDPSNGRASQNVGSNITQMNIALAMSLHTKPLPFDLDNTVSTNPANTPALYNLSSLIGTYDTVTGYLYTNESSAYSNSLSFYSVLDATGLIEDPISGTSLNPGDRGYLAAAKALADEFEGSTTSIFSLFSARTKVINFERQSSDIAKLDQFTLDLNGLKGGFVAPIVTTSAGDTWVPFAQANSDGQQHFLSTGIAGWRMEDMANLGDGDFNDLHAQLIITELT